MNKNSAKLLRKTWGALVLAGVLGGAAASAQAQTQGTLTVAITQDAGNWDPIATFTTWWGAVGSNIYDGLTMRGADLKLQPGLATSWEFLDNDKRIRFHLRQGVTFQDGEPFNADAVKFTFDRLLGPLGAKGPQQANYTSIDHVQVVDQNTVDFYMKSPDPVLLTKLAGYGAMIVPPAYIKEKGDAYFAAHPIGTGPFKVVDYQPKISLTLQANDKYWGGKPKLDKVVYDFISEPNTQAAELQSGRIDVATSLPLNLLGVIAKASKTHVMTAVGPVTIVMGLNSAHGITANADVRRALILAVDRNTIVKQLLMGYAKPIASFQGPASFGYDPELKPLPFDPKQAIALLKKAGIKPGTKVEIDVRGPDSTFNEVAQAVAGYLQGVGLQATIKPYDTTVLISDIIPNGKTGDMYQNQWGGWTYDYDNTAYLMYHSGAHYSPYVKDAKLDQMLDAERATYDQNFRQKTLRQIADYVAQQSYEIPLYNLDTVIGVNKRVKDLVLPGDMRFRFLDTSVSQ